MVTCCAEAHRTDRETPIPELSTRFRALKHRNFQLFIIGQLISLIGTWMQTTAQQWLVYKLTGSVAVLGVFGFASQVPMLLLAWMGGYVGDRYNRHRGVIDANTFDDTGVCAGGADADAYDSRVAFDRDCFSGWDCERV